MNSADYELYAQKCRMGAKPACSCACPLNVDVVKLMELAGRGNLTAAYKHYCSQVLFPAIVCRVCDQPCRTVCVLGEGQAALSLQAVEAACVAHTRVSGAPAYGLPRKTQTVAVIGAGLAGLACAHKLDMKGFSVTVYEREAQLGGRLRELLPADIYLPELQLQLARDKFQLCCGQEITALEQISADAIFIATGADGEDFGLSQDWDGDALATCRAGVFLGGARMGAKPVTDIAQGVTAAHSIEKFLKTGRMDGVPESFPQRVSCLHPNQAGRVIAPPLPVPEGGYTAEQAAAEASRCIRCDCTECRDGCQLFDWFHKTPPQIVGEALTSLHAVNVMSKQQTTRLISSCTQCGLCGQVCPEGIDIGRLAHDFRYFRTESNCYPKYYSEFFLRDMEFATGQAGLVRPAPHSPTHYLFFPGCQLGAAEPSYVTRAYDWLRQALPGVGIFLGCCGAPADWAAQRELHQQLLQQIRCTWEEFERPVFILACPTCLRQFRTFLPELPCQSLYEVAVEQGFTPDRHREQPVALFDPCASRDFPGLQDSVRQLARQAGCAVEELRYHKETARCCSWGGHVPAANRALADHMVAERTGESQLPYLTYCVNCRDTFAGSGKACLHILDLLFDMGDTDFRPPSLGQKRKNRLLTKRRILTRVFGETPAEEPTEQLPELNISPELLVKMSRLLILEDEIRRTVAHAEQTCRSIYDPQRDSYTGYLCQGLITYWAEYRRAPQGLVLLNAYCHRMRIDGEAIAGETASPEIGELPTGLTCALCEQPLTVGNTRFTYLGHELHSPVPRCPECGQVYLPETLVNSRVLAVEAALEDK